MIFCLVSKINLLQVYNKDLKALGSKLTLQTMTSIKPDTLALSNILPALIKS